MKNDKNDYKDIIKRLLLIIFIGLFFAFAPYIFWYMVGFAGS